MLFEYTVQVSEREEVSYIFNGVQFSKEQINCISSFLKEHTAASKERTENYSDKPAMTEDANGPKRWHLNGQRHRTDGPAVQWYDGSKEWYLNDELHRTDGPAIEDADGSKYWCLNGEKLSEAEFNERMS